MLLEQHHRIPPPGSFHVIVAGGRLYARELNLRSLFFAGARWKLYIRARVQAAPDPRCKSLRRLAYEASTRRLPQESPLAGVDWAR